MPHLQISFPNEAVAFSVRTVITATAKVTKERGPIVILTRDSGINAALSDTALANTTLVNTALDNSDQAARREELATFQSAILGATWDIARRRYFAPYTLWPMVRKRILNAAGYDLHEDDMVKQWLREEEESQTLLLREAALRADAFDKALAARGHSLRPYQREGIRWLCARRSGLLTDEMGLGKTVQILGSIPSAEEAGVLIVCPASLRGYWRDEVKTWRPDLTPVILEGRGALGHYDPNRLQNDTSAVICSDSALHGLADDRGNVDSTHPLSQLQHRIYLAADEAHMFKGESARTRNMSALCALVRKRGGWTIGATGTPLLNNPEELFKLAMVFGCHELGWGSEPAFRRAFSVGVDFGYGATYGKPKPEAREGLARISLRRTRVEVLPELPPKSYQYIPVVLPRTLMKRLDSVEKEYGSKLEALEQILAHSVATGAANASQSPEWEWHDKMPTFTGYAEVRKDLAQLKMAAALEWIEAHEAENLPAVVFSVHRDPVDALAARPGWTSITGDTPSEARTARVAAFQRGEYRGILGTIGAMGTGHTLTKAAHCLFIDRTFTPGYNSQAEDRVYRLGQMLPVLISILVGDHPLERRLEKIVAKKLELMQLAAA